MLGRQPQTYLGNRNLRVLQLIILVAELPAPLKLTLIRMVRLGRPENVKGYLVFVELGYEAQAILPR